MPFFIKVDTASLLMDQFIKFGRGNQFSHTALEHLIEYYASIGMDDIELDVIALCCDFTEDDLDSVLKSYGLDSFEELQDNTWAIMTDDNNVLYALY